MRSMAIPRDPLIKRVAFVMSDTLNCVLKSSKDLNTNTFGETILVL